MFSQLPIKGRVMQRQFKYYFKKNTLKYMLIVFKKTSFHNGSPLFRYSSINTFTYMLKSKIMQLKTDLFRHVKFEVIVSLFCMLSLIGGNVEILLIPLMFMSYLHSCLNHRADK